MKVNIEVIEGPDAGQEVEFAYLPIRIGRSPDCDLVLLDPTVSARHAFLFLEGDRLYLEDLGHRGSTRVDDVLVTTRCALSPNALVGLGATELKVRWDEHEVKMPLPDTDPGTDKDSLTPTSREPADLDITIIPEQGPSQVVRFRPPEIIVGRQGNCEIHVDDPLMSKTHFRIRRTDHGFLLDDLKSLNGTFVHDEEVTTSYRLTGDVEIRAGGTRFQLQFVHRSPVGAVHLRELASLPPMPTPRPSPHSGERSPVISSVSTAPANASYRVERWDEQVYFYESVGPHPPIATLLSELSRHCPMSMLVDMPGMDQTAEGIGVACTSLLEDSWGGVPAGSPTFLPPEAKDSALNLTQQMAGHDCWVGYFGFQDSTKMLSRLRALGSHRDLVGGRDLGAAVLARPSILSARLKSDHRLAREVLAGWKAILMEGPSPGSWLAIAGPGFRRGLERAGLQSL